MARERIPEVERLRGIAFLAVVLQHSIAHYSIAPGMTTDDGILMAVLLMATKFAVPVFVFITGLVLFYNDRGQLHYGRFIKKRFGDIYIPFAVWTVVTILINSGFNPFVLEDWKDLSYVLITGKSSSHFWYIIMLFQMYLLYPLFRPAFFRVKARSSRSIGLLLLLLSGALYLWLISGISEIGQWMGSLRIPVWSELFTTYADRNALYYFFYFTLGAAAGLYQQEWKGWIRRYRKLNWVVFAFLFGWMLIQAVSEIRAADGGITFYSLSLLRPSMALFLISSIIVMYDAAGWICKNGGETLNKALTSIGLYSYGAYLMHLLTLRLSYTVDESLLLHAPASVRIAASWIISAAVAYGGTYLLSKLPFGKWLVGLSGRRGRSQPHPPDRPHQLKPKPQAGQAPGV